VGAGREPHVLVDVHVVPGARRDEVGGQHDGRVRVRVRAPAVDGKANAAVRDVLAKHLGVRRSAVTIVRGDRSRRKTVRVDAMTELPDLR
jgi:uncharacterized protein (TIGR00251 family)